MSKVRGLSSIFELLKAEKVRILQEYELLQSLQNARICPSHEWVIKSLEKLKIEEDNPFFHDEALWKMGVTFNKQNKSTLKITLNLVQDPFQNKKGHIYFKKREFFSQNQIISQNQSANQELLFGIGQNEGIMNESELSHFNQIKEKLEAMRLK